MRNLLLGVVTLLLCQSVSARCVSRDTHKDGTFELYCADLIELAENKISITNLTTRIRDNRFAGERLRVHPLQSKGHICKLFGKDRDQNWSYKVGSAKFVHNSEARATLNGEDFIIPNEAKRISLEEIICKRKN